MDAEELADCDTDRELATLRHVLRALLRLAAAERARILVYLNDRFNVDRR